MSERTYNQIFFNSEDHWIQWLEMNHDKSEGIWIIFYKEHTGKKTLKYNSAVEIALCFGWIDSIIKRLDDEKYIQKFTPRKSKSKWSDSNIQRVQKLIVEGKMREYGLRVFPKELLNKKPKNSIIKDNSIPDFIIKSLENSHTAYNYFQTLPPSHKRNYIGWVCDAKREETRIKRLNEMISLLEQGKKLGLK